MFSPPPLEGWGNTGIIKPANAKSYGLAWRVLDAQYFGVPQRRRRVFVVGYFGDWRPAAAVLLEFESMSGNPAPRRKKGKGFTYDVAPCVDASGVGFSRTGDIRGQDPVIGFEIEEVARTLTSEGSDGSWTADGRGSSLIPFHRISYIPPIANCLETTCHDYSRADGFNMVAFDCKGTEVYNRIDGATPTLRAQNFDKSHGNGGGQLAVASFRARVRRLTPRECERLQGFPDDHTLVPYGKGMMSDSARYRLVGNSFPRPVIEWIGRRITLIDQLIKE